MLDLGNFLAVTRAHADTEAHGYAKRTFGFQPSALKEYVLMFCMAPSAKSQQNKCEHRKYNCRKRKKGVIKKRRKREIEKTEG